MHVCTHVHSSQATYNRINSFSDPIVLPRIVLGHIKQCKPNSQFVVTKILILYAGGVIILFRFQLVESAWNAAFELVITEALPFNCSTQGGRAKVPYSYCNESETL